MCRVLWIVQYSLHSVARSGAQWTQPRSAAGVGRCSCGECEEFAQHTAGGNCDFLVGSTELQLALSGISLIVATSV